MNKNQQTLFPDEKGRPPLSADLPTMEDDDEMESTQPKYQPPKDRDLPVGPREQVPHAPPDFKEPTFFAAVTCLAALATRVRAYYPYDGMNEHALLLQTFIVGEQSAGKSFARNHVERVIMAPLKKRDDEQRRQEQAYRELRQTASKMDKLPEPPHTVIRTYPISISIAQLIKRADAPQRYYGTPMTLWSFTDELKAAVESNKRTFCNIKTIARTSYDLNSTYGVDYLSDNAYSATVDIMICSLYLTTPSALDAYADNDFIEGGGVTRTILVTLHDTLGDDAPIFKQLTPKQKKAIDNLLELMDNDVYDKASNTVKPEKFIDMQWLFPTICAWCDEQKRLILRSASRAHDTFYKRSSVSAFRIATLCAYLYGLEQGTDKLTSAQRKRVKQIYLFAAQYILDAMMGKWGHRYEQLTQKRIEAQSKVRVPLFNQLTDTFTRDQLTELVKRNETGTPVRVLLSKWKAKGWIEEKQKYVYKKTEK